jgi:hypothetical protein
VADAQDFDCQSALSSQALGGSASGPDVSSLLSPLWLEPYSTLPDPGFIRRGGRSNARGQLPKDIKVVQAAAWSEEKCRRLGFTHVDYRCLMPLYRTACKLLRPDRCDVVFFFTIADLETPIWMQGRL